MAFNNHILSESFFKPSGDLLAISDNWTFLLKEMGSNWISEATGCHFGEETSKLRVMGEGEDDQQ